MITEKTASKNWPFDSIDTKSFCRFFLLVYSRHSHFDSVWYNGTFKTCPYYEHIYEGIYEQFLEKNQWVPV